MIPSANYFGKIVDTRILVFRAYYYGLTENDVTELAGDFYSFVNAEFGNECVLLWHSRKRVIKDIHALEETGIHPAGTFDMDLIGDVKSRIVYNKTTLRRYDRDLEFHPVFHCGITPMSASVDYPEFAKQSIKPHVNNPDELQQALLAIFQREGCINKGLLLQNDVEGFLFNSKFDGTDGLYAGKIELRVNCISLADELDNYANSLVDFGRRLSLRFVCVNVTIGIDQSGLDYVRYYGGVQLHPCTDSKAGEVHAMIRHAKYLYMQEVGWANIISPIVMGRIQLGETTIQQDVQEERLANGALYIHSSHGVANTTLAQLSTIKQRIYPAMMPGISKFGLDWPYFRSFWENVPLVSGELAVTNKYVFFRHKGYLDEGYVKKSFECICK